MLATPAPARDGESLRLTLQDGRQVAASLATISRAGRGFFVVPADNRTNTERI